MLVEKGAKKEKTGERTDLNVGNYNGARREAQDCRAERAALHIPAASG
jgi:hypothetical protein